MTIWSIDCGPPDCGGFLVMMMNTMRNYELESFDPPPEEEEEDVLPLEPEITEEDVERARRSGIQIGAEQGFSAGEKKAREELESFFAKASEENDQAMEKLFQQLADQFEIVFEQYQEDMEKQTRMMLNMSKAVWKRLMPCYVARYGDAEVLAVVEECMQNLRGARQIVIQYASSNAEKMQKMLAPLAKIYEGRAEFVIQESEELSESDVTMNWGNGSAERSMEELMQVVEGIVDKAVENFEIQQQRDANPDPEVALGAQ